ncbi:hypothetical protein BsWGS_22274 [Bradybaena similaris]
MSACDKLLDQNGSAPTSGVHGKNAPVEVRFVPKAAGESFPLHQLPGVLDKSDKDDDVDDLDRHTWSRKVEYVLTTIGFCVGMGNVLRFPYICIRNGGGAFLLPYFLCLVLCGLPLFFLEVGLGQFLSRGALHVWSICPLFKGIGITMNILSLLSAWYFSIIISLTLVYAFHSFKSPLPWTLCGQSWNSKFCVPSGGLAHVDSNFTSGSLDGHLLEANTTVNASGTISSTREFWLNNVLQISSGFEEMGGLPWHTTLALFLAVAAMFACIIQGVHSVGKVVYVTATVPYILLTLLIIQGALLPGAIDGVKFYIWPDFWKLTQIQTWVEACIQVFSSLGPAYGGLITMASYNKFKNNCMRDAIVLSFVCEGTSIFAGFAIFTVLGHMAHTLNVTVSTFTSAGPGLAFVVYPEAISYLPVPQLWGVLFFVMLFTVALDSQFTLVETVLTSLQDYWPRFMNKWNIPIKVSCGVVFFLMCLPFAARGGMYLFQLIDWYFSVFTVLMVGILECVVVAWIYGADRFLDDLTLMLSRRPPYLFVVLWRFVTPLLLLGLLITTLLIYRPPSYEGYEYGAGAVAFGWIVASVTFVPVPVYAIYILCKTEGSFLQRLKTACRPSAAWRPGDHAMALMYTHDTQQASICSFRCPWSRA